jgi:hypothetical protein
MLTPLSRVDSDRDGRAAYGHRSTTTHGPHGTQGASMTPGSGNASNTAGPHNSDMLNKLDPR